MANYSFPPINWPTYFSASSAYIVTLNDSSTSSQLSHPVFPGRPYVIRGWMADGNWGGVTVNVNTAAPSATVDGELSEPYYDENSLVPITATPFTANFEHTFCTSGQAVVITTPTPSSGLELCIWISAVTSHE